MCLTCRFAVEKCEVQLQGYDRWMKPLFVTFVFLQLLLFCSYSFSFIKYYLVFIISQSDFIAFFMSVLSVLNVQHPFCNV